MLTWILSRIYVIGTIIAVLFIIGIISSLVAAVIMLLAKNPKIYIPCVLLLATCMVVGCHAGLTPGIVANCIYSIANNKILYIITTCLGCISILTAVLSMINSKQ